MILIMNSFFLIVSCLFRCSFFLLTFFGKLLFEDCVCEVGMLGSGRVVIEEILVAKRIHHSCKCGNSTVHLGFFSSLACYRLIP